MDLFNTIFGFVLSIIPSFFGKVIIIVLGKEVDDGNKKQALHNKPRFRWGGLAFFTRYQYHVARKAAKTIADKIKKSDDANPDLIVGIGRGGAIFGSLLSYRLENTPLLIVDRTYSWNPTTNTREDGILYDFIWCSKKTHYKRCKNYGDSAYNNYSRKQNIN